MIIGLKYNRDPVEDIPNPYNKAGKKTKRSKYSYLLKIELIKKLPIDMNKIERK